MCHVCARNVSSRKEQAVYRFGHQASIRDGISFGLVEGFLRACFIQTIAGHVMHIEVKVSLCNDPIVKNFGILNVLLGNCLYTLEVARFPDTDQAGRGKNVTVFISRSVFAQEINNGFHLFTAGYCRFHKIIGICSVNPGAVCHVTGDNTWQGGAIEQNVTCRKRKMQ